DLGSPPRDPQRQVRRSSMSRLLRVTRGRDVRPPPGPPCREGSRTWLRGRIPFPGTTRPERLRTSLDLRLPPPLLVSVRSRSILHDNQSPRKWTREMLLP